MKKVFWFFFPMLLFALPDSFKEKESFFSLYLDKPLGLWHEIRYFSSNGLLFLEDGSTWKINPKQRRKLKRWKKEDLVLVQQNTSWVSSYPYCLKNRHLNEIVEVALFSPSNPEKDRGSFIKELDLHSGLIALEEGSVYNVCFFSTKGLNLWRVGDPIIVGVNASFLIRGDFILINTRNKEFLYVTLEKEGRAYEYN